MKKYLTAVCSIILCTVPAYAARWSCPSCTKEEIKTLFEKHAGEGKLDVMLQEFDRRLDTNTNTLVGANSIAGICQSVWGMGGEGTVAWNKCAAFATDMVKLAKSKQTKKTNTVKTPAKATNFGGAVVCNDTPFVIDNIPGGECVSADNEAFIEKYRRQSGIVVYDLQAEYDPVTKSWGAPTHDPRGLVPSTGVLVAFDNGGNVVSVSENGQKLNLNDSEVKQKANAVVNSFKNAAKIAIGSGILILKSFADVVVSVFDLTQVLASSAINELKAKGVALGNKVEEIKNDAILSAKTAYRNAKAFASDTGKKIVEYYDAAGRKVQDIYDEGGRLVATVVNGVVESFNNMMEGMKQIAAEIKAKGENLLAGLKRAAGVTKDAIVFVTYTSVGVIIIAYDETGKLIKAGVSKAQDAAIAYTEAFADGVDLIKQDFSDLVAETQRRAIAAKAEAVRNAKIAFNAAKEATLKAIESKIEREQQKYEQIEKLVLEAVSATGRQIRLVYDTTGKMINATIDGVTQTANQVKQKVGDIYDAAEQAVADFAAKAREAGAAAIDKAKETVVAGFRATLGGIKAVTDYQRHLVQVTIQTTVGLIILAYDEAGNLKDAVVNATTEEAKKYVAKFNSGLEFIKQDLSDVANKAAAEARALKQAAVNRARQVAANIIGAGKYAWEATTEAGNRIVLYFDQAGELIEAKLNDANMALNDARTRFVEFVNVGMEKARVAGEAFVNELSRMASNVIEQTMTGVKIAIGSVILVYDAYGNVQEAIIDGVRYSIYKMGSAMQNLAHNIKQKHANLWVKVGQAMEEKGIALQEEYNMDSSYYQYAGQ